MKYRHFGKLDWDASALGFGCMRLPTQDGAIDEPEAIRIIRYAIEHGVNYFDSAYGYHGGQSEVVLGKALQDGYRQRVKLVTKLPTWQVTEPADFDRLLNEQLTKLGVETLDVYLLHSLNKNSWIKMRDMGIIDWAEAAMAGGRFKAFGFSFHDNTEAFKYIVDDYAGWAMAQIQHNYIDVENQAGTEGLLYGASKGLAMVIMEPILGGRLANPPESVQALWDSASVRRSPVDWALQWLWNQPEVTVALSGMSDMEQVQQNIASAGRSGVGSLSEEELALVVRARETYEQLCPIPCTDCKYCMPCPNGVNIPRNFSAYNGAVMYNQAENARRGYQRIPEDARASACIQCRECEPLCPQSIPISEWMPEVDAALGQGGPFACRPVA